MNLNMNPNNDYDCFLRRQGPQGWTRARAHHRHALELFLEMPLSRTIGGEPVRISVPHLDGGDFVAFFQRVNPVICQYRDLYGGVVDIMMSSGAHAAYVNRVIDHF
jgi:hypothetical protein